MATQITASAPRQARKKQRTRAQIAQAAAQLFARHGFERVTIVEVARAADVSEQTVYNHFPSKERLVFDEDDAMETRLVAMIRDRAPGTSLVDAVRGEARAFLEQLARNPAGAERAGGMPALIAVSPSLRRHWLEMVERHTRAVAAALVAHGPPRLSPASAHVLAIALTGVFTVIVDELGRALVAGRDPRATLRGLRRPLEAALDRLAAGL